MKEHILISGENSANGPDLDQLEELCSSGGAINGASCNPLCIKSDEVCVKMTYYRRDKHRTIANYSSFCGQGVKVSDGSAAIQDSCHIQHNVNGYDVEACFCDKDRCNGSTVNSAVNYSLLVGAALILVAAWSL